MAEVPQITVNILCDENFSSFITSLLEDTNWVFEDERLIIPIGTETSSIQILHKAPYEILILKSHNYFEIRSGKEKIELPTNCFDNRHSYEKQFLRIRHLLYRKCRPSFL